MIRTSVQHLLKHRTVLMVTILLSIGTLVGCEGSNDVSDNTSTLDTGSISFNVAWNQRLDIDTDYQTRAVVCGDEPDQVATVSAAIVNTETSVVKRGGPWECFAPSGTIQGVPVGSDYTLLFYGHNEMGRATYSGVKLGISVDTGTNNIGTIDANRFFTEIIAPPDTSTNIDPDRPAFSWTYASGAARYQIWISESQDLSNPLTFDTEDLFFNVPFGFLDVNTTYYWTVFPFDIDNNRSYFYEDIYSFTTASGSTITDDNYEENDTKETAFDLSDWNGSFLFDIDDIGIAVLGDDDFYRIDVPYSNAILEIDIDCYFFHDLGDIDIELYDANGNLIIAGDSTTDDEYIYFEHSGGPATYYIKVFLFDGGAATSNAYDLGWWAW